MPRPSKLFVAEHVLNDLDAAAKINHMSLSSMLTVIANAFKKGQLTVYNGEIMARKTIYETPKGRIIR